MYVTGYVRVCTTGPVIAEAGINLGLPIPTLSPNCSLSSISIIRQCFWQNKYDKNACALKTNAVKYKYENVVPSERLGKGCVTYWGLRTAARYGFPLSRNPELEYVCFDR